YYIIGLQVIIGGSKELSRVEIDPVYRSSFFIIRGNFFPNYQNILPVTVNGQIPCQSKCFQKRYLFVGNGYHGWFSYFTQNCHPKIEEADTHNRIKQKFLFQDAADNFFF